MSEDFYSRVQRIAFRRQRAESDSAPGLRAKDAPTTWVDHEGRVWQTPRSRNALNATRAAGHKALRRFVLFRDGGKCQWCAATEWLDVDHIISVRCGGAHHPDNLRLLCRSCNTTKANVVDARRAAA